MMSTRVWHSGTVNAPRSMSLKRSGSGSSFFEYCTSACIFSSRPIDRNSFSTRSIDGGMAELDVVETLSMRSIYLISFRGTVHHMHGKERRAGCQREKQPRRGKADSKTERGAS